MAQKSYFTHSGTGLQVHAHAKQLRDIAASLSGHKTDYSAHATTLRTVADRLDGGEGKKGVKEHRGNQSGDGNKRGSAAIA